MGIFAEIPFPRIDPAIISLPGFAIGAVELGPFSIRWYAMAYLVGAFLAYIYIIRICRHADLFGQQKPPDRELIDELLFNALLGALIGGRVGYILFYQIVFDAGRLIDDPLMVIRIWEGGMSFHGGMIGVLIAIAVTARSSGTHFLLMLDLLAVSAPPGLFLGRIANFINGELYGRSTDVPWAMRFPTWNESTRTWIESGFETPVHPSQLYEAALEGLLLFVIQAVGLWRFQTLSRPGLATALFLLIYACSRILVENFRSPDAQIDFLPGIITMGMVLSAPMIVLGAVLAAMALKERK